MHLTTKSGQTAIILSPCRIVYINIAVRVDGGSVQKLCGFILFWMAVGMAIGMYLDCNFFVVCLVIIMMVIGFNLFCKR
jgi:hypothetical protein